MKWPCKPLYLLFILFALLQSACSHFPGISSDKTAELKLSAQGGDARSQLLLAHLLDEGAGLPRDLGAAAEWYGKSAGLGNPEAGLELARLHLSGKVPPEDGNRTVQLLFSAGKAGYTEAQALLGALFLVGRGKEEFAAQVRLTRSGADKGEGEAEYTLGWILREGAGVPRGVAEAQNWLIKAARQGNSAAALLLGDMTFNGEAAQKDTSAAIIWYEKAAVTGNHAAITRLSLLQGKGIYGTMPLPAATPRQRLELEADYRRLQLEFAEKSSATNQETALLAARRLLELDPADREARNLAERLWNKGGTELTPLFMKAEQQLSSGDLSSFTGSLEKIISLTPDEMRLRELNTHYWLLADRTAALEKKREALKAERREERKEERREEAREKHKEEPVESGDALFKKGVSLLEGGQFDAAAKLFTKLTRTPGYTNIAGAYIYLGITSLARINMSKINEAKKLRLKGIASFQNALRFDRKATLPAGYVKYKDIFEEAINSLK